jgi:acyl-CoA reductase-like NAD-dependent aldehyde dehydrogenase
MQTIARLNDPSLFTGRCLVGGKWIAAETSSAIEVANPATGEIIGNQAIAAGARAFGRWGRRTAAERAALLEHWHDLVLQSAENLALLMTLEEGKPLAESRAEISYGASFTLRARFFEPTLLTEATRDMLLASEEMFGPVAPLFRFRTEEEAIEIANDTPYGLAAYLYTRDVGRCFRLSDALEVGMVGINSGAVSYAGAPFGVVKESGLGREGSHHGIEEFLEMKTLHFGGL